MELRGEFVIAATHPSLPGHFPGLPVVPGVVVLDEVRALAERTFGAFALRGMPQVKFLSPLLPQQRAQVAFERDGAVLRFAVTHETTVVARGELTIADATP